MSPDVSPRSSDDEAIGVIDFVVTGTGRCGTGFTSAVLTAAGVPVGHEEWFTVDPGRRRDDITGDVSWLAVPDLDGFSGRVVHQVRHPLEVVRSLVGIGMFSNLAHGPYRWFMYAHLPGLTTDDETDAIRWWVEWNERIEQHATMRVRLRDLDAAMFEEVCAHVGHPVPVERLEAAVAAVGTGVNARRRSREYDWDDLPVGAMTDRLKRAAARYGYDVP